MFMKSANHVNRRNFSDVTLRVEIIVVLAFCNNFEWQIKCFNIVICFS